jgi:Ni,Fe-hydrogenase maturation factor
MKILCLGNEFIKEDSLGKKIAFEISRETKEFVFIFIKDSFELIEYLKSNDKLVILDVVKGINEVVELGVQDLGSSGIMTAHDFDASFFLQLLGENKDIKIIGIPIEGDTQKIKQSVKEFLSNSV